MRRKQRRGHGEREKETKENRERVNACYREKREKQIGLRPRVRESERLSKRELQRRQGNIEREEEKICDIILPTFFFI